MCEREKVRREDKCESKTVTLEPTVAMETALSFFPFSLEPGLWSMSLVTAEEE